MHIMKYFNSAYNYLSAGYRVLATFQAIKSTKSKIVVNTKYQQIKSDSNEIRS